MHAIDVYAYLDKDEVALKRNVRFQGFPIEMVIMSMCDVELLEPLFINSTLTYRFANDEDALGLVPELDKLVQSMFVQREDKLFMSLHCMEGMRSIEEGGFQKYVWEHSKGAPLKWKANSYIMQDWLAVNFALCEKGIIGDEVIRLSHPYPFWKFCKTEFPGKQLVIDGYVSMSALALLDMCMEPNRCIRNCC